MRRVLLQMGLSVDGIVAGGPQGGTEAGARDEDEAVRTWKVKSLHQVGTHIMGRVSYERTTARLDIGQIRSRRPTSEGATVAQSTVRLPTSACLVAPPGSSRQVGMAASQGTRVSLQVAERQQRTQGRDGRP